MPINLDDIQSLNVANTKIYSAKFFHEKFTGDGRSRGLLNDTANPINQKTCNASYGSSVDTALLDGRAGKIHNDKTTTYMIPINPMIRTAYGAIQNTACPDVSTLTCIGENANTGEKLYVDMLPHSAMLFETATYNPTAGKSTTTKELVVCYAITLMAVTDDTKPLTDYSSMNGMYVSAKNHVGTPEMAQHLSSATSISNAQITEFTCDPVTFLYDLKAHGCGRIKLDISAIDNYIGSYCLHEGIVRQSQAWQESIHDKLRPLLQNASDLIKGKASQILINEALNIVAKSLRYIESHNIPLELYRLLYTDIESLFTPDVIGILCDQNLNLLLNYTLNNLDNHKNVLCRIPPMATKPTASQSGIPFSPEQYNALSSDEPLILVQAGAGTGKSTVILGRIDYMVAAGIPPEDITVLSFTNAAADNITDKNPNVNSMTIARMIHTIYSENYPEQQLSSLPTIMNALDIYYPMDETAQKFKKYLELVNKTEPEGVTRLNTFIRDNEERVIEMLNAIKQTALELEIIICYLKIDDLVEPQSVRGKFMIVDEVQDNSIFEFIYILKYVAKRQISLFIVGDCSQTLYEFRASNPRALNVLEGSGVFQTFQLQTNYRSNQEILDFANVLLRGIEANQYANIQLQAHSMKPVTEKSFTDAVTLHYELVPRLKEFNENLSGYLVRYVKEYIDDKRAKGEPVAFLAATRNHVGIIERFLANHYPDANIKNLVPETMKSTTIFSTFIMRYWEEIQFVPSPKMMFVIGQKIMEKLPYMAFTSKNKDALENTTKALLDKWYNECAGAVGSWFNQYAQGQMTKEEFVDLIQKNMLDFEIRNNAIRQALMSSRNEQRKRDEDMSNADFIISTIHSAKGLEFKHVVVLYRNTNNNMAEDQKRMYYVAFTRAMETEFIFAWDSDGAPQIEADYETIVERLQARDAAAALNNGTLVS